MLDDGRRVLTQESFLKGMGRAAKAKGGQGVLTVVDDTPAFLAAANLKPLIEREISASTTPIEFSSLTGTKVMGYAAELLPEVCRPFTWPHVMRRFSCQGKGTSPSEPTCLFVRSRSWALRP